MPSGSGWIQSALSRIAAASLLAALICVSGCRHVTTSGDGPIASPTAADKALAARAEAAAENAMGTPAQEMANMVLRNWQHKMVLQLKGSEPATATELENARKVVAHATTNILERGPTWPAPPPLMIPHTPEAPRIDGKVDEPIWQKALTFRSVYPFNTTNYLSEPSTTWRVLWDETHLYFAFECADDGIVAPEMKRDAAVFNYDCVEMFILPEFRLGQYWEIVISPSGSLFDGLHTKKFDGWGMLGRPEVDMEGLRFTSTVERADGEDRGYTVEVAVPFAELPTYTRGNKPQPGDVLHFMLVRLDKNGDALHTYAFQPLLNWGHNIWNHCKATLVK